MGHKKVKSSAGTSVQGTPTQGKKKPIPNPNGNRAERRAAKKKGNGG